MLLVRKPTHERQPELGFRRQPKFVQVRTVRTRGHSYLIRAAEVKAAIPVRTGCDLSHVAGEHPFISQVRRLLLNSTEQYLL